MPAAASPSRIWMLPRVLLVILLLWGVPLSARAQCTPVDPIACPECFAVFVMPDTQLYTFLNRQPEGAAHFDLLTRYICDNAAGWVEPSTGKQMPICCCSKSLSWWVRPGVNSTAKPSRPARLDAPKPSKCF